MKASLHAQASAVDVAWTQAKRRGTPNIKPKDWEYIEAKLAAACLALRLIDANRHRIDAALLAELEGDA